MNNKRFFPILSFGFILSVSLSSCGGEEPSKYNSKATIDITTTANVENKVFNPNDVEITMTMKDYESKGYYNTQVMPSTGNVNILVVPVLIPEYTTIDINNDGVDDKDSVLRDISTLFSGNPENDERLKFGSVSSFYKESSYGKLHLNGVVADWFDVKAELGYTKANEITSDVTTEIMEKAVEKYKKTTSDNMKSFDSDTDGFIDAIWLVYSAPDYTNGGPMLDDYNYWAYTSWANQDSDGDVDNPVANVYGWASYDFMYEGYETTSIDSHTFIHETGHFLGLNDYYSTDGNASYSPLGKVDMMDNNIIDHNSYSKMLLGWTKPYLVYGNATIDLNSMQNENSFIIIQSDDTEVSNKFNPFGEYILIELYTNEGLNNIDSVNVYDDVLAPKGKGVRIYHIDKRLYTITLDEINNNNSIQEYDGENLNDGLVTPITNSRDNDVYNTIFHLDNTVNLYDEIRLIEASGKDSFSNGGYQTLKSYFRNEGSFSLETYNAFFENNKDGIPALNNGKTLSYKVGVSYDD